MTMLASQITSLMVVYSIVYLGVNQRKHQSSASLAFVREIHRGPVNFPHKWPVTRKMFPLDDVIMTIIIGITITLNATSTMIIMMHYDVIEWKHFPRYWPFVRGIHRSPVNSPHKGQLRGAVMISLTCALNKRLSKQTWGWWFETQSRSLWRHCYEWSRSWSSLDDDYNDDHHHDHRPSLWSSQSSWSSTSHHHHHFDYNHHFHHQRYVILMIITDFLCLLLLLHEAACRYKMYGFIAFELL